MSLVHVEFDWSDEFGTCEDCGRPAAYENEGNTRYCSVDAAWHVSHGDGDIRYLFPDD